MVRRVCLLRFGELEGLFRRLRALLEALKDFGLETLELDLSRGVEGIVRELENFKPQLVMDANLTGLIFAENGEEKVALCDLMGFAHLSFLFENPLYLYKPLKELSKTKNLFFAVFDLKHYWHLKDMELLERGLYLNPFSDQYPDFETHRDVEMLFLGPVYEPRLIYEEALKELGEELAHLVGEAGEFSFRNPEVDLRTSLDLVMEYLREDFRESLKEKLKDWETLQKTLLFVGSYSTSRRRSYFLKFLEGMDVKVLGDCSYEGFEVLRPSSYEEVLRTYARSKVVITLIPQTLTYSFGFTPLDVCRYSLPLMDYRPSVGILFNLEREVLTFLGNDLLDFEEKLLYLLENPEEREERARNCKEALSRFSFKETARFIKEVFLTQ